MAQMIIKRFALSIVDLNSYSDWDRIEVNMRDRNRLDLYSLLQLMENEFRILKELRKMKLSALLQFSKRY